jgi:hypothetical protein
MNPLRSLERWDRGFESHSRRGCLYCLSLFCIYVALCVGRGLAKGWSPSKESYGLCIGSRNWKSGQGPTKGCRAIIIIIIIIIIMPAFFSLRKLELELINKDTLSKSIYRFDSIHRHVTNIVILFFVFSPATACFWHGFRASSSESRRYGTVAKHEQVL